MTPEDIAKLEKKAEQKISYTKNTRKKNYKTMKTMM
jgi:hypothetical protein